MRDALGFLTQNGVKKSLGIASLVFALDVLRISAVVCSFAKRAST